MESRDLDNLPLDEQEQRLKNKDTQQLIEMRKEYARKIFYFISIWSVFVFLILISQGFTFYINFSLSDGAIITLISTTFLNVVSLMYIVLKYLFPFKNY
jgi:hypothetical protein